MYACIVCTQCVCVGSMNMYVYTVYIVHKVYIVQKVYIVHMCIHLYVSLYSNTYQ